MKPDVKPDKRFRDTISNKHRDDLLEIVHDREGMLRIVFVMKLPNGRKVVTVTWIAKKERNNESEPFGSKESPLMLTAEPHGEGLAR